METETLIIGASSAGMAMARQLQERGKPYLQVDRAPVVAQMWRNTYDRLHLHTARARSSLPFQPLPRSYPRYPSRQQVVDYLEAYRRELAQQPLFRRDVHLVSRDGEAWRAEVAGESIVARNVVIATGNTRDPVRPTFE